jgi:tetratricopeptide (TPR) repeat protein
METKKQLNDAEVYNDLGFAYSKLDEYSEVIKAFEEVIKIKSDAGADYNFGFVYGIGGEYNRAIEAFRHVIENIGADFDIYYGLGFAYSRLGK